MSNQIAGELAVLRRAYQLLETEEEIIVSLSGSETTHTRQADIKLEIDSRLRQLEAELVQPTLVTDGK